MRFNLLDLAVVAVLAVATVDGLRRGFAAYLTELAALAAGLGLALWLFEPLGALLHRLLGVSSTLAGFGAFIALLAAGHGIVVAIAYRAVAWASSRVQRVQPRVAGGIGGISAAGLAAVVCAGAVGVLAVIPAESAQGLVAGSLVGRAVTGRGAPLDARLRLLIVPPTPANQSILVSSPASNPGQDAFYKLTFPANLQPQSAPADEDAMLQKINDARAGDGLSPLRMDPTLRQVARAHSWDMYARDYFSHQTPDGKTPYDRLQALKVHYLTAGENLAFAPDVGQAWDSLLHSPDHRANILNPDFRCVGIGAYQGQGGYEEMFTQDFTDC
ncbi:MAG: CAP domain-containing protein [Candidatus Dormibacteraeota bacterium]|nr:CAP domain-containing protein [Candidatus Dormibacteraeota bacterium]